MLFSLDYHSKEKDFADEIRCPCTQLGLLFNYIKDHPEKRYLIIANTTIEKVKEQIDLLKAVTDNYTIQCNSYESFVSFLTDGYNAFVNYPINDWENFNDLIDWGASDIYIDGSIAFSIDKIASVKKSAKIRIFPTESLNSPFSKGYKTSSFFVRPEDLSMYEEVVDIIEFKGNKEKEDILFKVYKRGSFIADIDQLIPNLPKEISNLAIGEEFAQERLNCGQRCKMPGNFCRYCSNYLNYAHIISKQLMERKEDFGQT